MEKMRMKIHTADTKLQEYILTHCDELLTAHLNTANQESLSERTTRQLFLRLKAEVRGSGSEAKNIIRRLLLEKTLEQFAHKHVINIQLQQRIATWNELQDVIYDDELEKLNETKPVEDRQDQLDEEDKKRFKIPEEDKVDSLKNMLRRVIPQFVGQTERYVGTAEEYYRMAIKHVRDFDYFLPSRSSSNGYRNRGRGPAAMAAMTSASKRTCHVCGDPSHFRAQCPRRTRHNNQRQNRNQSARQGGRHRNNQHRQNNNKKNRRRSKKSGGKFNR